MIQAVAIVGANLSGARAAEALRLNGYDGRVILVGDESWLPYERPPLSKEVLLDAGSLRQDIFIRDQAFYDDNRIELRLGARVLAIDPPRRTLTLASGGQIQADTILLATGGQPRRLSLAGADAANVHYLRTINDARRISRGFTSGARVAIVGMGVIGSEVAASARRAGCDVIAIDPAAAPMLRNLGETFGKWLGRYHESQGVQTLMGRRLTRLIIDEGRVYALETEDGARLRCDMVVVGIGIRPADELAAAAGLVTGNGILVDTQCRTSHKNVYASGDVANQPDFFGGRTRLETFQNAGEQGEAAAKSILGMELNYCRPCWFWSDQYDLNIQVCGRIDDRLPVVVRGEIDSGCFSAFFVNDNRVEGAIVVNNALEMSVGRRLIEQRCRLNPQALADSGTSLRSLIRSSGPQGQAPA